MVQAYQIKVDRLREWGISPKHYILDNKILAEMKECIGKNGSTYQLIPPHDHCCNIAKKAIQVFKDHFISILCGADPHFPMHLWCRLLLQAERMLNMLRQSRVVPQVSAYTHLHGPHDYNSNPYAPLGCAVEVYAHTQLRNMWEAHMELGFYIGTSMEHYRCHQAWISKTRQIHMT